MRGPINTISPISWIIFRIIITFGCNLISQLMNDFFDFFKKNPDYLIAWIVLVVIIVGVFHFANRLPAPVDGHNASLRTNDSAAREQANRDSIQAVIDTKVALEAQREEDRKFYASKAGRIHKKHPDWSREACQRVANKEIWIGMGLDMLKYERGLPDVANPSDYGNGVQWQWCWHDWTPSCFYDKDNDGHIDSYN